MMDVYFDGKSASEMNCILKQRPDLPYPEEDIEEIIIPGRDGSLHQYNERKKQIDIPVSFSFIDAPDDWATHWRAIGEWLSSKNSELKFSDDTPYFYMCSYASLSEGSRLYRNVGEFTVTFHCEPAVYVDCGTHEQSAEYNDVLLKNSNGECISNGILSSIKGCSLYNIHGHSYPMYRIEGSGNCCLTINGNQMLLNISDYLVIDTKRKVAYKDKTDLSHTITGDYEDISFKNGDNTLSISSGFSLFITPNWRI